MYFKKLNEYFSYNIIALTGWIGIFFIIFLIKVYSYERHINAQSTILGFYLFFVIIFILCIFCISFIVFVIEKTFNLKIKNRFLLNNKILNFLRIIGILLSIFYFLCIFMIFL